MDGCMDVFLGLPRVFLIGWAWLCGGWSCVPSTPVLHQLIFNSIRSLRFHSFDARLFWWPWVSELIWLHTMTIKSTDFQVIRTEQIFYSIILQIHTLVVLSRTQDCTLAFCSNNSTVVIPQTQDCTGTCVIKSVFSRKTSMENSQRHQLAVLALLVFCTEKQDRRKSWRKSWQKACTVTVCNIRLQMLSALIFLIGYCRTSIVGRPTWDQVWYLRFKIGEAGAVKW